MNIRTYLRTIAGIPRHLFMVILGLLLAMTDDRTAGTFVIGGAILTAAYGWPIIGALVVLYGVLMFVSAMVQAVVS